jgi:vancomycin resistance protein VanJ
MTESSSNGGETPAAPRRSWRRRAAGGLAVGLLVTLLLRLTVADRWPVASMLFYATPWPLITLGWFLAVGLFPRRSQARRWSALMALVCLTVTVGSQWVWNGPAAESDEPGVEIQFWNVARGQHGWNNVLDELRISTAEVIALCESESRLLSGEDWRAAFPERYLYRQPGGLLWISRRPVDVKPLPWAPGLIGGSELILPYEGQLVRLLLIDLAGAPYLSRKPGWTQLGKFLEERRDDPTFLIGDLNTPDDSVWTETCRKFARPAFRSHGRGYAATWPLPCPVMALDQAWVTEQVEVQKCELGWSPLSDHRWIRLTVRPRLTSREPSRHIRSQ